MTTKTSTTTTEGTVDFTKIIGKPTAMDIARIEKEAFEYAGTMENSKTARFGHSGMLMEPEAYTAFTTKAGYPDTPWEEPTHPGEYPSFKKGDDKDMFRIMTEIWNMKNTTHKEYIMGKKNLKQQFLNAVDPTYLREIRDPNETTMGVGPKTILDHLKKTYGQITAREVESNRKKLYEPWDGRTPIAELWERLQNVRDLATFAKAPINDIDSISAILQIMDGVPDFADAVKKLRMMNPQEWNWESTVSELTKVDNARDNTTTANNGYHTANEATSGDNGNGKEANSANAAKAGKQNSERKFTLNKHEYIFSYCYSCGWSSNRDHNSANCPSEGAEHKKYATAYNNHGGCQKLTPSKRNRTDDKTKGPPTKR